MATQARKGARKRRGAGVCRGRRPLDPGEHRAVSLVRELYPHLNEDTASAAEALLMRLRSAQEQRNREDRTWPLRADDWLAEVAVDVALQGSTIACLVR